MEHADVAADARTSGRLTALDSSIGTRFVGRTLAVTSPGLAAAAKGLDVGAVEIWTVVAVETSGCGFLPDRRPQILYERHIFSALTKGRFDDGDISDPRPGGYGALGAHQYDRLGAAIRLDRVAALKSASWGLAQILGRNFSAAGFADVESMVAAIVDSEDAQLAAMTSFIQTAGLGQPLATHDWAAFARGYNGPQYAKNLYDVRLQGEYQKLVAGVLPSVDVRAAQLYLTCRGFHPGPVDGVLGKLTRAAVGEFQRSIGAPETERVTQALLTQLQLPVPSDAKVETPRRRRRGS